MLSDETTLFLGGTHDVSSERDDKTMKIRIVIAVDAIADNVPWLMDCRMAHQPWRRGAGERRAYIVIQIQDNDSLYRARLLHSIFIFHRRLRRQHSLCKTLRKRFLRIDFPFPLSFLLFHYNSLTNNSLSLRKNHSSPSSPAKDARLVGGTKREKFFIYALRKYTVRRVSLLSRAHALTRRMIHTGINSKRDSLIERNCWLAFYPRIRESEKKVRQDRLSVSEGISSAWN